MAGEKQERPSRFPPPLLLRFLLSREARGSMRDKVKSCCRCCSLRSKRPLSGTAAWHIPEWQFQGQCLDFPPCPSGSCPSSSPRAHERARQSPRPPRLPPLSLPPPPIPCQHRGPPYLQDRGESWRKRKRRAVFSKISPLLRRHKVPPPSLFFRQRPFKFGRREHLQGKPPQSGDVERGPSSSSFCCTHKRAHQVVWELKLKLSFAGLFKAAFSYRQVSVSLSRKLLRNTCIALKNMAVGGYCINVPVKKDVNLYKSKPGPGVITALPKRGKATFSPACVCVVYFSSCTG